MLYRNHFPMSLCSFLCSCLLQQPLLILLHLSQLQQERKIRRKEWSLEDYKSRATAAVGKTLFNLFYYSSSSSCLPPYLSNKRQELYNTCRCQEEEKSCSTVLVKPILLRLYQCNACRYL